MLPKRTFYTYFLAMSLPGATLFVSCHGQKATMAANETKVPAGCDTPRTEALKDLAAHDLKYYTFGIVGPSKKFVDSLKRYDVTAVSLGCNVNEKLSCYNSVVDSIVYSRHHVHITDIR